MKTKIPQLAPVVAAVSATSVRPDPVRVDFNRSVILPMFTGRRHVHPRQVAARYPAGHCGTRVELRDDGRRDDPEGRDNRR